MIHLRFVRVLVATTAIAIAGTSMNIEWKDLSPMPVGVAGGACGLLAGTIVYAGGTTWAGGVKQWLRDVRQYDLAKGAWANGPSLPEPLAYGGCIQTRDSFEILGGLNENGPSRNCWRLERDARQWIRAGTLPQDGALARAERVGDATYLIGGCPDAADLSHCNSSVFRMDSHKRWVHVTDMPDGPVALRASAVLNERIYLFGGCIAVSATAIRNSNGAWRYDPGTGHWQKLRSLPEAVRATAAAYIDRHRILLAGGYTASQFSDAIWIYDAERDTYERAAPLPVAVAGIALIIEGQTIFGLGGEDRMRGRTPQLIRGRIAPIASNTLDAR